MAQSALFSRQTPDWVLLPYSWEESVLKFAERKLFGNTLPTAVPKFGFTSFHRAFRPTLSQTSFGAGAYTDDHAFR